MPPDGPSFPPLDRPELDEDASDIASAYAFRWRPDAPLTPPPPDWDGFAHEDLDE